MKKITLLLACVLSFLSASLAIARPLWEITETASSFTISLTPIAFTTGAELQISYQNNRVVLVVKWSEYIGTNEGGTVTATQLDKERPELKVWYADRLGKISFFRGDVRSFLRRMVKHEAFSIHILQNNKVIASALFDISDIRDAIKPIFKLARIPMTNSIMKFKVKDE